MPELPYTYEADVRQALRRKLPSELLGADRTEALIEAWANAMQAVEFALFQLATTINNPRGAGGDALDTIAKVAGAGRRGGLSDARFRRVVLVAIVNNRSTGTRFEVVEAARAASAASAISYTDTAPAAFRVVARVSSYTDEALTRRLAPLLRASAQAGVGASYIEVAGGSMSFGRASALGSTGPPFFGSASGSSLASGTFAHVMA